MFVNLCLLKKKKLFDSTDPCTCKLKSTLIHALLVPETSHKIEACDVFSLEFALPLMSSKPQTKRMSNSCTMLMHQHHHNSHKFKQKNNNKTTMIGEVVILGSC